MITRAFAFHAATIPVALLVFVLLLYRIGRRLALDHDAPEEHEAWHEADRKLKGDLRSAVSTILILLGGGMAVSLAAVCAQGRVAWDQDDRRSWLFVTAFLAVSLSIWTRARDRESDERKTRRFRKLARRLGLAVVAASSATALASIYSIAFIAYVQSDWEMIFSAPLAVLIGLSDIFLALWAGNQLIEFGSSRVGPAESAPQKTQNPPFGGCRS